MFFNLSRESYQVVVPLVDDELLEANETFTAAISLTQTEDRSCVVLRPNTVEITLLDNDSETSFLLMYCKGVVVSKLYIHKSGRGWLSSKLLVH